ncbi:magnesium transporter [Thermogemmatispora carboxidivorans]|uniref:magnesium transporter n=1 Tax=Thermogemmatispora carboxidivorans TaxID=1382306 RepID=UPI00069A958B|nr:magnesium transporter [Thermogemmatispora carboxidivorans]
MREHSAEQGAGASDEAEGTSRRIRRRQVQAKMVEAPSELPAYFPDHLADFYQLLKSDYEELRRANRIIFYETRVIVWLCVIVALVIMFRASVVGGSILSVATLLVSLIGKLIKVKSSEREDLGKRLEALRLTTLEIERICLSLHLARSISDQQRRDRVLEELAEERGLSGEEARQFPAAGSMPADQEPEMRQFPPQEGRT